MPSQQPLYVYPTSDASSIGKANPLDPFSFESGFPATNAILQPRKSDFTPTTLGTTTKTYTSKLQADISAIALWCANNYMSYSVQENPGQVFSITITVPYDEITNADSLMTEQVIWEVTENIVNRDIFEAGIYTTNALGQLITTQRYTVPPFVQIAIREALKYGPFGQLNLANNTALTPAQAAAVAPLNTIAQQFYQLLKSGVTSVKSATIHVKRTAVYAITDANAVDNEPYYALIDAAGWQQSNINPIISRSDLIKIFQPDQITQQQLLPSYSIPKSQTAMGDISDMFALGGYLVHVPVRTFITPTKISIVQLFEWDEWLDCQYFRYSNIGDFPMIYSTPYPPGYSGMLNV